MKLIFDVIGDQRQRFDPGAAGNVDDFHDLGERQLGQGADEDGLVLARAVEAAELLEEAPYFVLDAVDLNGVAPLQGQDDKARGLAGAARGVGHFGQVDIYAFLNERRDDHEDDEKNEKDVAERNDVRLGFCHDGLRDRTPRELFYDNSRIMSTKFTEAPISGYQWPCGCCWCGRRGASCPPPPTTPRSIGSRGT